MSGVSNYVPYSPNSRGLTEVLIDLKVTMSGRTVYAVAGFEASALENVVQGDALYARTGDGLVGKAIANSTEELATVIGFAQTTKSIGQLVRVLTFSVTPVTGLSPGILYFLSAVSPGNITETPPNTPGHYVTRVGEAASSSVLIVQLEPPIQLS